MIDPVKTLMEMIRIPSFSREEEKVCHFLRDVLKKEEIDFDQIGNNLVCQHIQDQSLPWVLLCSHYDTVRPNEGYTRDPFDAAEVDGKIYGLGSNDAGASLVSMLRTFQELRTEALPFNLMLAMVAEEEVSGSGGLSMLLENFPPIHFGIIGEPTNGDVAIAEKGLMVIDAEAQGIAGHAAHHQGRSSIDIACEDIDSIHQYVFDRVSPELGLTKATVSQISAGQQHNQVPASCQFVIDVRTNELYSNEEVFNLLSSICQSKLKARSFRLQSSRVHRNHPFVQLLIERGLRPYGSPTLSDQALLPFETIKLGPGKSERSHTADEFVLREEIESSIALYLDLLKNYNPQ